MAKLSRELSAKGVDVINLTLGEPDFQTPTHIKEAAKKAIDDGYTFYTPVAGIPELRKAICDKFKKDNNLDFLPENIVVSTGAKHSIINTILALINPGDEVIIPTPYWVSYSDMIHMVEGKCVFINSTVDADFKITAAQLEKAITPKTKLFMFSSPCNPTGSVYSKDELKALAEVFEKNPHVYILSDEIYEHINFVGKHESIAQFDSIKDRVITVNGVSKGFAMTGWRIGYIGARKDIAFACEKIQSQYTSGTGSISQCAALAALTGDMKPTHEMNVAYKRRRDLVLKLMKDIPGFKTNTPEGAFYVFPDISYYFGKSDGITTINSAEDFCMFLLETAHVSVVTGDAFGAPECIRFAYATSDENLVEGLRRIKEAVSRLN